MGRKKSSPAEDFIDIVALMPWWAGVLIAAVSYAVLHRFAAPVAAVPGGGMPQMLDVVRASIVSQLAWFGQFIVPLLALLGAVVSFLRRRKRAALIDQVANGDTAALNAMSWLDFERMVGEAFRLQGYTVKELGGAGPDGGVDLTLRKGSNTYLVQCKQWKVRKVRVQVVRELFGLMAAKGAAGAFVVTSGHFTADAEAFARGRKIELIDGAQLFAMVRKARAA